MNKQGGMDAEITIGNDIWIGYGVTILAVVHVADGAILASGALIIKDVPAYVVVGGIPAKIIKFRNERVKNECIDDRC